MPREENITTFLNVSADLFWALRSDTGFDKFCAEQDGAEWVLDSVTTNEAETPPTEVTSSYCYSGKAVPALLRPILGEKPMILFSRICFWQDRHDESHPSYFQTVPSIWPNRIMSEGSTFLRPLSANSCELVVAATIEVRIFGVGRIIDAAFVHMLRESYKKLDSLVRRRPLPPACAGSAASLSRTALTVLCVPTTGSILLEDRTVRIVHGDARSVGPTRGGPTA